MPIKNAYPEIEAQYNRLELDENGSINEKTPAFAEVYSRWGGQRELNPRQRDHNPLFYH